MKRSLFRPEVFAQHQEGANGEVLLARLSVVTWLVSLAVASALAVAAFVIWGEFTRKEHVSGYLLPTRGLVRVFAPLNGTVVEKRVHEGQRVEQGEMLLVLSSERGSPATRETQAAILGELRQRRDSLRSERSTQEEIDALASSALASRARGIETELAAVQGQLDLQNRRVAAAERTVTRHEQLVAARFVAEATLQQKQEELLDQRNQLAQVQRNLASLQRDLAATRSELAASRLQRSNHSAAIERQISELEQQLTDADSRRSFVVSAPVDGTVTTILAEPGQSVASAQPLLTILPAGAELQAQLLLPTRAAGFIHPGQEVVLRYQAFPYQRFGHHLGEVSEVGRSVLQPGDAGLPPTIQEAVYRVTVRLPTQSVQADGKAIALQAGMQLDADIHVDRRRLIEWLFDPLVSIMGRV